MASDSHLMQAALLASYLRQEAESARADEDISANLDDAAYHQGRAEAYEDALFQLTCLGVTKV